VGVSEVEYERAEIAAAGFFDPVAAFRPGPSPAAGAGFRFTVPGTYVTMVQAISFRLVTAADVANRVAVVSFLDSNGTPYAPIAAPFTQAASLTTDYTFAVGIQQFGANNAANIGAGLPPLRLQAGISVAVSIVNVAATDQISQARLLLAQWPVRP
jgi:hypothetical protein